MKFIKFGSPTCNPCIQAKNWLLHGGGEHKSNSMKEIKDLDQIDEDGILYLVDIDANPHLAYQFGVPSIPAILVMEENCEDRFILKPVTQDLEWVVNNLK